MKVLLVTMYFPPSGGGGVQRPLKFATHLPAHGIETHVLAPDDPKWLHRDEELRPPTQAFVHRARYLGPKARLPSEELRGLTGVDLALAQARLAGRRLLLPDASVLTAFFFIFLREIRAVWFLGIWILFQLWDGGFAILHPESGGGTAFFAHIGGFAFGALTVRFVIKRPPLRPAW